MGHPHMTDIDGTGGCVALVLRHTAFDTMALVLNVDGCVDDPELPPRTDAGLGWSALPNVQRPLSRIHVHLPPLAHVDARKYLPKELHRIPMRWGGAHPVPLHLLHSVPLVDPPSSIQVEPFQRLTGHYVCPGLWCSYVDREVIDATERALDAGAGTENFGAYVGMICLERNECGLLDFMTRNHWLVVRPRIPLAISPQGWSGGFARGPQGEFKDDRQWDPWRTIMSKLGGEFADWAKTEWVGSNRGNQPLPSAYYGGAASSPYALNVGGGEQPL